MQKNIDCVVTDMTNEHHIKKYGRKLNIHHWNYDKEENNPFYFVPVTCVINGMANNKKQKTQWIELFNLIAEERWCELLKKEGKNW